MKKTIRITVLGLLTLFSGYLYLLEDTPVTQKIIIKEEPLVDVKMEQIETLDYLNKLRVGAGLIPLISNKKLGIAAKNHANYLIKNGLIGHYEDKNKIGYTGKYGGERSLHSGYKTSMVIENISNNNFTHKESVDGLMAAIYHRFGFLDFNIDEIGIGIQQHQTNRDQTAFVYDMGSHKLEEMCYNKNQITSGEYLANICADKSIKIKTDSFNNAIKFNRDRNSKIVTYPFNGQTDVPPVFYDELPDPLPEYSVSGFPISMSFNEAYFKSINMISFKIFDKQNHQIKDTIIYDHKTDPNKRLKKFEFALFPLQRLAWNSDYRVEANYRADGQLKKEVWQFKTRNFKIPIYKVTANKNSFEINRGEPIIFYFPPLSKIDTLGSLKYPASLDISFIDKNTIKLIANGRKFKKLVLNMGNHQLNLNIN